MSNELVHKYLDEAVRDYDQLDTQHDGRLNFVDIAKYEKLGPEQKAVGKFLEDNVFTLSGISEDNPMTGYKEVLKRDLEFADIYSGSDQKAKDAHTNSEAIADGIMSGAGAAAAAIIPAMPIVGLASWGGPFAAGAAAIVVEGGAAASGYALGSWGAREGIKERAEKVDSLRP